MDSKSSNFIDMSGTVDTVLSTRSDDAQAYLNGLALRDVTAVLDNSCHYLSTKSEPALRPLTVFVLADFDTLEGRDLLLEAVKYTVCSVLQNCVGLYNKSF